MSNFQADVGPKLFADYQTFFTFTNISYLSFPFLGQKLKCQLLHALLYDAGRVLEKVLTVNLIASYYLLINWIIIDMMNLT